AGGSDISLCPCHEKSKRGRISRIMKKTTVQLRNSMNRSHVRLAVLLIPLACFAFSPAAKATCQEGCFTDSNTALGDDALLNNTGAQNTAIGFNALLNNTSGLGNTAMGMQPLYWNTTGYFNTAIGFQALHFNTTGSQNTANGVGAL